MNIPSGIYSPFSEKDLVESIVEKKNIYKKNIKNNLPLIKQYTKNNDNKIKKYINY